VIRTGASRRTRAGLVALVALVLTSALVVRALSAFDWDVTVFASFGAEGPTRAYAEERLGEVVLRGDLGHDGKYFFVQANDPWLLEPGDNAEILDFPIYRSQRMFYPLLAGGFGLFGPETIVWGLLVVNVAAMALGTLGAARLARSLGGSSWWGLAFLGNLGLIFTLTIDSAGIVAAACAIWAVALVYEGRIAPAVGLLTAATLTREVMLLCGAGVAVWLWTEGRRRQALYAGGIPFLLLAVWEAYLRLRLDADEPGVGAIGPPLVGLVKAIPEWADDSVVLATGLLVIGLSILFVMRWWPSRTPLGWAFVGFVPLGLVLTDKVWIPYFDFTRALAPLFTAAILLVFVESRSGRRRQEFVSVGPGRSRGGG